MRRLLSILLLAAFALPLVAPLLALAQDPDANLPACCRRHGQHHCLMLDKAKDPSAHRVVPVCPAWPQRATPAPLISNHLLGRRFTPGIFHDADAHHSMTPEFGPVQASEQLHPKRGPPAEPSAIA